MGGEDIPRALVSGANSLSELLEYNYVSVMNLSSGVASLFSMLIQFVVTLCLLIITGAVVANWCRRKTPKARGRSNRSRDSGSDGED